MQGQLLFNAGKACGKHAGKRQIRVRRRVGVAQLHAARDFAIRTICGDAHERRAVAGSPGNVSGRLPAGNQALVGVHVLIGDAAELGSVLQKTGDVVFRQIGKVVAERIVRIEEGIVAIEVKQALVHVHARPGGIG